MECHDHGRPAQSSRIKSLQAIKEKCNFHRRRLVGLAKELAEIDSVCEAHNALHFDTLSMLGRKCRKILGIYGDARSASYL